MRTLVTLICIICAAILLVSPRDGFSWPTYEGGCQACHGTGYPALNNHNYTTHKTLTCDKCHTSAGGGDKPINTSKCIVCHPRTPAPGKCNLADFHDQGKGTSCLTCHSSCALSTTTTTAAGTTTTTPATTTSVPVTTSVPATTTTPASTTTTTPQDGCYINGPARSCQNCHAAQFTFGTPWHTSHQGYVGINCERCHIAGFGTAIPTRVCTACHNESATPAVSLPCDWVELNPTHKAVCVSCHTACNEPPAPPPGPCPAEAVLGENDPRLETLRAFRDQVLAKNPNGRKMIRMYYNSSTAVIQMLQKNPALKESAQQYLESILPTIELMTKQKAARR